MRFFLLFISILFCSLLQAQTAVLDAVKAREEVNRIGSVTSILEKIESFGERKEGNDSLHACGEWLAAMYKSYGYIDVRFDTFDSPLNGTNYNVVVTHRNNPAWPWIIVGSHYDSKGGAGVNDNGTGVAATMLIAERLIHQRSLYNFQFVHFAGEEQGFYGSIHHAREWQAQGDSIYFYFNLDQLGGTKGATDNLKIYCEQDENNNPPENNSNSSWITREISYTMPLVSDVQPVISNAFSSDYEPFQARGYTITGLYQFSSYPFGHQAGDTLGNVDTGATREITKGAYGALLWLGWFDGMINSVEEVKIPVRIYPNPVSSMLHFDIPSDRSSWDYQILDHTGRLISEGKSTGTISNVPSTNGLYFLRLTSGELSAIKRFVVAK